jgi:hypothetical protein
MHVKLFSLGLSTLGFAAAGLLASAPAAHATATSVLASESLAASAPKPETSIFGEPLFVNGKRVSDNEIKRYLIYGPCRLMLEMYRINLIVDDELSRRARDSANAVIEPEVAKRTKAAVETALAGKTFETPEAKQKATDEENTKARAAARGSEDLRKAWQAEYDRQRKFLAETVVPNDAEYNAELKRTLDEFKTNYPVLDLDAEVSRAFRTVEWYKKNLRQTLLFDRVFYPDNPEDWPITTVEAVRADSGDTLLTDARDSYKMRKEHADKTGEPLPKEDPIYTQMMRQIVRDGMYSTIDFRTAADGLPDDLLLSADKDGDGKPELIVTTAEVWDAVKDTVSPTEIDEAKQWFVTSIATADRLKADGFLLDEAARQAVFAEQNKQFIGTYYNMEILATQTYFFPSVETFREYYCLHAGFKKLMEPKLQKQENGDLAQPLRDYLDRSNRIMGLGQIDLDCMLISAFDIPHFKWKPEGWTKAKKLATDIKADLEKNIADYNAQRAEIAKAKADGKADYKPEKEVMEPYQYWSKQMDDHSEYWDPPSPEKGKSSDVGMKKRGRFGLRYRNDLQGFVGETPYSHWVTGESITDYAFFDQAEGAVAGPFKGPLGYYLTRVQRRLPPTRPLNLGDPKHVDLLKDDYLRVAFVDYAKEAVKKADVKGFTKVN